MNIITLHKALITAIATDNDTKTWLFEKYSLPLNVLKTFDEKDPPGQSDCPFVFLGPTSKVVGQNVSNKIHVFDCFCGLYDDDTGSPIGLDNVSEHDGFENLETFRKYVETAIAGYDSGNLSIDRIEVSYFNTFPLMVVGMKIIYVEPVTLGCDPLL